MTGVKLGMHNIVKAFAKGLKSAESRHPCATNTRSKVSFQAGIGPHSESEAVKLITDEMQADEPNQYKDRIGIAIPYPELRRQKCDLCIGDLDNWDWAIEIKMLRFLGDNGKLNDNILMHILSPYPEHRRALTDCEKLVRSSIATLKGILIYGYSDKLWPLEPAIDAFEVLARKRVTLSPRCSEEFSGLVHPVHKSGMVFGWGICV